MAVTEFPRSLDPADGYASWDLMRLGAGECLTRFDRSMTPQPWLAERWTLSPDRLTWTFHLRPGLRFSNGKPLTAEAARASLLRLFGRSVRAHSFFEPAAITADGLALSIRTTRPAPNLPGLLADPLFLLIDAEDAGDIRRTGPVTTGPYRLVSASGDVLRLEANPWYHEGPPPFRRVEAPLVPDPGAAAMTLQTGEADLLPNAGPENLVLFRDTARYHISETATLRSVLARFHAAPGRPLADPRVRAALIAACDRKTYCEVLLDGSFLPGGPAVPPSMDCGFEELADPNPYDPARAARLLDEAGWTDTDGDGIRDKDGRPLALTFLTYPDRPYLPALAEAVQADARAAGIRIDIEVLDYNVLVSRGKEGTWAPPRHEHPHRQHRRPRSLSQPLLEKRGGRKYHRLVQRRIRRSLGRAGLHLRPRPPARAPRAHAADPAGRCGGARLRLSEEPHGLRRPHRRGGDHSCGLLLDHRPGPPGAGIVKSR